jgi:hypothetical protein
MFKQPKSGNFCPLLKRTCIESQCMWWIQVRGKHPQSEEQIDHYGCAVAWLPVLQIETSQVVRGTGAATESLRNELVKRIDTAQSKRLVNG